MPATDRIQDVTVYHPKPDQAILLVERLRTHEAVLRQRACSPAQPVLRVCFDDGSALEIVDWPDDDSRVRASRDPAIRAAWRAIMDTADVVHQCRMA